MAMVPKLIRVVKYCKGLPLSNSNVPSIFWFWRSGGKLNALYLKL